MKITLTRIIMAVIGIAIVSAIVMTLRPRPIDIDTAVVERGPMQVTVDEDGRTRIRERYIVSAPLAGRLQRIHLRAGDAVTAADSVIAIIEPADPALLDPRALAEAEARVRRAEAALRQAQPALERARAEMDLAEDELTRVQNAFDRGAATQRELDAAVTANRLAVESFNAARFAREIAEYELELARAALVRSQPDDQPPDEWHLRMTSPIDGRVLRVFQESMAFVTAGTPLLELGDPTDLEVVIDVLSSDAVRIEPGAHVRFEHWGGEDTLHGRVRLVEPQAFTKISALGVEEQRVNVIADLLDPPTARTSLGDGYRVEARIVTWEADDVLIVPINALFRRDGQWAVFVVQNNRAELRQIDLSQHSGLHAHVVDGLEAGDIVIAHPSDDITPGAMVRPQ